MIYDPMEFFSIEVISWVGLSNLSHGGVEMDREYVYVHQPSGILTEYPEKFVEWVNSLNA